MSLDRLLTQVDSSILQGFEYLTRTASSQFNWSKYDLMRGCSRAATVLLGVSAGYSFMTGSMNHDLFQVGVGASSFYLVASTISDFDRELKVQEEKELEKIVQTGAAPRHFPDGSRPLFFGTLLTGSSLLYTLASVYGLGTPGETLNYKTITGTLLAAVENIYFDRSLNT